MILITKTSDQTRQRGHALCVCVCVFFPFILDIKWTYQPGSHRRKVICTGFFIHLPSAVRASIFSREKDAAIPFVDHEVEFCVLTI